MPYKVIQWATGYTGIYALKYILNNPALELVGLKCFSPEKAGRDAGSLVGLPDTGVKATLSTEDILALEADCVIYTPGVYDMQNPSVPGSNTHLMLTTLLQLLESGKNVASTVCPFIDTGITSLAMRCARGSRRPAPRVACRFSQPASSRDSWAMSCL